MDLSDSNDVERQRWHQLNLDYLEHAKRLGKERLVVSAVICVRDRVLLVRRSINDSYPGMWEYPGGGVDEVNEEDVVSALRREVLEETGIAIPEYPSGEVLVHPTRTALRVVLRFDVENIDDVSLSEEHDAYLLATIDDTKAVDSDGHVIYDTMRQENQGILLLVLGPTRTES